MDNLQLLFDSPLVLISLLGSILCGICCGCIGVYVSLKKINYLCSGVTHASFSGLGLAFFLGLPPQLFFIPATIISSLLIGLLGEDKKNNHDSIIGIIWSFGMAIGIFFTSLTQGYTPELSQYLFGNITFLTPLDLLIFSLWVLFLIASFFTFHRSFLFIAFDKEYAKSCGFPVLLMELFLFTLIGVSLAFMVQMIGIVLVVSLVVIPPALVIPYANSLFSAIIYSSLFAVFSFVIGFIFSFFYDIPLGSSVTLVSCFFYFSFNFFRWMKGLFYAPCRSI